MMYAIRGQTVKEYIIITPYAIYGGVPTYVYIIMFTISITNHNTKTCIW